MIISHSESSQSTDQNQKTSETDRNFFFIMGILATTARTIDTLVGPGVMLLYPLLASMKSIESPNTLDDQQWLTYWVLYSFITLFELFCHELLSWVPIWPYVKLVFCLWLVLPMFNGAAYIYDNYVRPYTKNMASFGINNSNYAEHHKKVLQMMSFDVRKSVESYIQQYGPDAFDRVIKTAEKEARKH